MNERTGLEQLDDLINLLIEKDQTGDEIDPLDVAHELGRIRALIMAMPTVHRSEADERHFRCESCGTISHGSVAPARCVRCGKSQFLNVDIDRPPAPSTTV